MIRVLAPIVAICVAAPSFAQEASGEPEEGEKVFRQCRACHMVFSTDGE